MDGGENVAAADEETVKSYLKGIKDTVDNVAPDILLLQECL